MKQHTASLIGSRSLTLLGMACALSFAACSDENGSAWSGSDEKKPAEASAPSAPVVQNELFDYMVYTMGAKVGQQGANPLWREDVREMRNRLEAYYNSLGQEADTLATRVKLGLLLAKIASDLKAYDRALTDYENTLKNWEALPEADRSSLEGRRTRSSIANGMGFCYLAKRNTADALRCYEQALELDESIFNELAPADGAPLPTGNALSADLARASEDVLSSYRCLGECQFAADDPEEARDTYKRGQDLALRMKHMTMPASLQFIRLLSSLGNLESNCGRHLDAAKAWATARNYAQQITKTPNAPAAAQAQAARFFRELDSSIKSIAPKLKAAESDAAPQQ